ncbi:MAG: VanZ family protein [Bacteroidetes bacterium]|nr:VanZ family protein [Bacteroidota bacterium]
MTIRKQWPAITWALFILIVTGIPGNQVPRIPAFLEWLSPDKLVHVVIFGILSYFMLYGYRLQYLKSKHRSYIVFNVVLISATYGMITELLQYYMFVGRSGNVFDFYANAIGAVAGGVAYFLQHTKNKV